ncbi:Uncharacterised protein [Mycobacteroides abscessus subsp. abscessus]|nr:Uncharacterised protein [Mycobacteroides abscessus subsp. abscessus]
MKIPTSATPAARSTAINGTLRWMPATLIAMAATPRITNDHSGIRNGSRSRSADLPGRLNGTSTITATVRIASAPNAQRHTPNCANKPPDDGPSSVPTPHIADTKADAFGQSDCGRAVLITA